MLGIRVRDTTTANALGKFWAFMLMWAVALVVLIFEFIERLGFSPTDDGFILAQTYRILHGQVPHRDFISVTPAGSPLLHVVDFVIPLPLLEAARLVGLLEVVTYTVLFALLLLDRPLTRWRGWEFGLVTVAVLVNVNTFPVMGWPTIDGLLFIAVGLVALRSGIRRQSLALIFGSLSLIGVAAVMKQSFFPAPLIALVWVFHDSRQRQRKKGITRLVTGLLFSMGPLAIYVLVIAVLGGWRSMLIQTTTLAPTFHDILFFLTDATGRSLFAALIMTLGGVLLFSSNEDSSRTKTFGIDVWFRIGATVVLFLVPVSQRFASNAGTWATQMFWALAFFLVGQRLKGRWDWVGVSALGVAGMTMLSVGYATPGLVAGSILLYFAHRLWSGVDLGRNWRRQALLTAGVAGLISISIAAVHAARSYPYYDSGAPHLTATLGDVATGLEGIRTNETTAAYMRDIATCIRRFPAASVAVLPDNPVIYPTLHLRDPFPIDWLLPLAYRSSVDRIIGTAHLLNERGDYLVLFQPVQAIELFLDDHAGLVNRAGELARSDKVLNQIDRALGNGVVVRCGVFVGRYSAPA